MKILHIYKNYYPILGGIENHIKLVSEELAQDQNFEVTVLVANSNLFTVIETVNSVKVVRVGRQFELASTPVGVSMIKWLRILEPDLIHLHFPYPPGEIATLLAGKRVRIVLTYHGDIVRQQNLLKIYTPLLFKVLEKAEVIIATNPNYISSSEILKRFKQKVKIVPLGISLSRFLLQDIQKVREVKKKYGDRLALFVGRFRYYKGLEVLLEAVPQISANLLLIGDGPVKMTLEKRLTQNGLRDKVFFLGEVSDAELVHYYHAADLFVLPSTKPSEAFGITLLEAMAAKKPVISTELGTGTSFVNQSGKTGLVIPPGDSQALAEAVNYLLDHPDLSESMGQAGYERVSQEFSSDKMIERLKKIYLDQK